MGFSSSTEPAPSALATTLPEDQGWKRIAADLFNDIRAEVAGSEGPM